MWQQWKMLRSEDQTLQLSIRRYRVGLSFRVGRNGVRLSLWIRSVFSS